MEKHTFRINIVTYLTMERKLTFICVSNDVGTTDAFTYIKTLKHFTIHQIFIIQFSSFSIKITHLSFKKKYRNLVYFVGERSWEEDVGGGTRRVYLDILFPDVDELEHNKSIENW